MNDTMGNDLDKKMEELSAQRHQLIDEASVYLPEEMRNFTTGVRIMVLRELVDTLKEPDRTKLSQILDTIDELGRELYDLMKRVL